MAEIPPTGDIINKTDEFLRRETGDPVLDATDKFLQGQGMNMPSGRELKRQLEELEKAVGATPESAPEKLKADMEAVSNSGKNETFDAPHTKDRAEGETSEGKEVIDYSSARSLVELDDLLRNAGAKVGLRESLSRLAEFIADNPDINLTEKSDLFKAFSRDGGLRDKVFELVYTKPRAQAQEKSTTKTADEAPSAVQSAEDNREDVGQPQEGMPQNEAGADSSDDVEYSGMEGMQLGGIGAAGSFDELYVIIRNAKTVHSPNGKEYPAEDIIKRIENARTLSKDRGNIDWIGVEDVTSGPGKGGPDDLQGKLVQLLKQELGQTGKEADSESASANEADPVDIDKMNLRKDTLAKQDEAAAEKNLEGMGDLEEEVRTTRFQTVGDSAKQAMRWLYKKAGVSAGWMYEHVPGPKQMVSAVERRVRRSGVEIQKDNAIDRAKVLFGDQMANWHTSEGVKLSRRVEEQNKLVGNLREKVQNSKVFLVRDFYEAKLRGAEDKAEKLKSKLEYRNDRRSTYENERDAACREYMDRVSEKIAPYQERIRDLAGQLNQLEEQIKVFIQDKEQLHSRLEELQSAKAEVSIFHRAQFNEQIKQIRTEIKDFDGMIRRQRKEQNAISVEVAKAHQDIDPWKDRVREMAKVMERRKDIVTAVSKRRPPEVSNERKLGRGVEETSSHAKTEATEEASTEASVVVNEPMPEVAPEAPREFSINSLVFEWNKRFGVNFRLDIADFADRPGPGSMPSSDLKLSKGKFAEIVRQRVTELEKTGTKIADKRKLEKDLDFFTRHSPVKFN